MLSLSLVMPSKKILADVETEEILVPSYRGELNILEGHAPLMATLSTGIMKYRKVGDTIWQSFAISWGYLEVSNNRVTVLAETAETAQEVDIIRAEAARDRALKALGSSDTEQKDFLKYQLKLERSLVRLHLADQNGAAQSATISAEKRGDSTSH